MVSVVMRQRHAAPTRKKVARGSAFAHAQCCRQMHTCPTCVPDLCMTMKAAQEDEAAGRIMFVLLCCLLRQHLATMTHGRCVKERQAGACVWLALMRACSPLAGAPSLHWAAFQPNHPQPLRPMGGFGRCALTSRKRAARRTRRLPVSSSSCAISVRTASGVSAAASRVNLHSRLPRFRSRNDSRWQHLTRSSSVPTQYPVAQVGQDQFFDFAGLLNQPWATRQ